MRGQWRRLLDSGLALGARLVLRVFFREVEVVGAERVPRGRPLLVVANHENNLIDPLLVLGFSRARPRFLAKSTLFSHPLLGPVLRLGGALPVHRRQDSAAGADLSRNFETFARCGELLAEGGTVALFPEGTSHNRPHRLPLKTGAARIALEAEARHGPLGLLILPVGLTYEAKGSFRSRVVVQIGPALDVAPTAALYASDPRRAVRELTARMAEALSDVTLNYGSWEQAHLAARAAVLLSESEAPGATPTLSELWALRKWVSREYQSLQAADPARAGALMAEVARYDVALSSLRLPGHERGLSWLLTPARRLEPGQAAALILLAPVALVGAALNGFAYRAIGWLARRLTRTPDEPATYKVVAALLLYPLVWILEAVLAAGLGGVLWGLAVIVAAPLSGYAALVFAERWRDLAEERRRARFSGGGKAAVRELVEHHERLRRDLAEAARAARVSGRGA